MRGSFRKNGDHASDVVHGKCPILNFSSVGIVTRKVIPSVLIWFVWIGLSAVSYTQIMPVTGSVGTCLVVSKTEWTKLFAPRDLFVPAIIAIVIIAPAS
jgi:hypothetical protein